MLFAYSLSWFNKVEPRRGEHGNVNTFLKYLFWRKAALTTFTKFLVLFAAIFNFKSWSSRNCRLDMSFADSWMIKSVNGSFILSSSTRFRFFPETLKRAMKLNCMLFLWQVCSPVLLLSSENLWFSNRNMSKRGTTYFHVSSASKDLSTSSPPSSYQSPP